MNKCCKCSKRVRGAKRGTFVLCKKCHAEGWKIERIEGYGHLSLHPHRLEMLRNAAAFEPMRQYIEG